MAVKWEKFDMLRKAVKNFKQSSSAELRYAMSSNIYIHSESNSYQ